MPPKMIVIHYFQGLVVYIGECLIMDDDAFSEMQQMRKYHRINKKLLRVGVWFHIT